MEKLTHPLYLFWLCYLLHLIADYVLQGILCNMKQHRWWHDQLRDMFGEYYWNVNGAKKYLFDYRQALRDHAFMWSILTFLPMMLVVGPWTYTAIVITNAIVHAAVDDLKANDMKINLQTDQWLHFLQIAVTVAIVQFI